jgi:SAM-dependent methyltransferase
MSITPEEAKARALRTYNSAADVYDDPANSFWERFGSRTIERMRLSEGATVLDVCCGSGASALPAAECVGPSGFVLGVDLADRLLEKARAKAQARGLSNIQFRMGDMLNLPISGTQFDAVVCVFGVFFAPDMSLALRVLWESVRSGGQLAITTWGPRFSSQPPLPSGTRSGRKSRISIETSTRGLASAIPAPWACCSLTQGSLRRRWRRSQIAIRFPHPRLGGRRCSDRVTEAQWTNWMRRPGSGFVTRISRSSVTPARRQWRRT